MDVSYQNYVRRTQATFWSKKWIWFCILWFYLMMTGNHINSVQISNDKNSSSRNDTRNLISQTSVSLDELSIPRRTNRTNFENNINSTVIKNISLFVNKTKNDVEILHSDLETFETDIKELEKIVENFEKSENDAEEIELTKNETIGSESMEKRMVSQKPQNFMARISNDDDSRPDKSEPLSTLSQDPNMTTADNDSFSALDTSTIPNWGFESLSTITQTSNTTAADGDSSSSLGTSTLPNLKLESQSSNTTAADDDSFPTLDTSTSSVEELESLCPRIQTWNLTAANNASSFIQDTSTSPNWKLESSSTVIQSSNMTAADNDSFSTLDTSTTPNWQLESSSTHKQSSNMTAADNDSSPILNTSTTPIWWPESFGTSTQSSNMNDSSSVTNSSTLLNWEKNENKEIVDSIEETTLSQFVMANENITEIPKLQNSTSVKPESPVDEELTTIIIEEKRHDDTNGTGVERNENNENVEGLPTDSLVKGLVNSVSSSTESIKSEYTSENSSMTESVYEGVTLPFLPLSDKITNISTNEPPGEIPEYIDPPSQSQDVSSSDAITERVVSKAIPSESNARNSFESEIPPVTEISPAEPLEESTDKLENVEVINSQSITEKPLVSSSKEENVSSTTEMMRVSALENVTQVSHTEKALIQEPRVEGELQVIAQAALKLLNNDTRPSETDNATSYEWRRICFQDLKSMSNPLIGSQMQFNKLADMYVFYYEPSEATSADSAPREHNKHKYTRDGVNFENDAYGAYSLHSHKIVSRYNKQKNNASTHQMGDSTSNSTSEASQPDYFCITVPAHVNQSSPKYNFITDDPVIVEEDARSQIFYYKKKMPFEIDGASLVNTQQSDKCDFICSDDSSCVTEEQRCDNYVHCRDLSDENECSCRDRMDKKKICDGYPDCPNGEDEEECFGCEKDFFNCADRLGFKSQQPTCIPMSKRCDNFFDCASHNDEHNCEVLTETVDSHEDFVSAYTVGYLHRNWRGKWYPVCDPETNYDWAVKACETEIGSRKIHVETELLPFVNEYTGRFISKKGPFGKFFLKDNCEVKNRAVHVKCPPIPCGSRIEQEFFESSYRSRRHVGPQGNYTSDDDPLAMARMLKNIADGIHYIRLHQKNDEEYKPDERVVGGQVSTPGRWPWLVAILKNGNFHCGGVILDENWIMTAAHCVYRYDQHYYEIHAGVLRRLSFSPGEQIRTVSQIILHPSYVNSDMQNDLALLRLESPLNYNRWVRPICLPEARPPWGPLPGTKCVAVGWGSTKEKGINPDNLKEVELPVLPDCKHLPDRQADEICAGFLNGGFDTCQGDSGGPLLCRIPSTHDKWYVAGVVSHGEGCARPMEPGAYTRVALYIPWLMQNTDYTFLRASHNPKKDCPGIRCDVGGRCIPVKHICDGVIDCLNAEDETGCRSSVDLNDISDVDVCDKQYIYRSQSLQDYKHAQKCRNLDEKISGSIFLRSNKEPDDFIPFSYNKTTQFLCSEIVQVLPLTWRCNGEVDCEDGSDEIDCSCAEYLKAENESLLCDGVIHCYDASDERDCPGQPCEKSEFLCYKSRDRTCINRGSVCNGKIECANGEDEGNCYAVVPYSESGRNFKLDYFDVPSFAERGILARNEKGIWRPFCTASEHENDVSYPGIITKILRRLGFKDTTKITKFYKTIEVVNTDILRPNYDVNYCQGISVDFRYAIHYEDYNSLPWHVDIYLNGDQRCVGLLAFDRWVIAEIACCHEYKATLDTVVAVMGGKSKSKVRPPFQQIIPAKEVTCHSDLNVMVIYLSRTPEVTLHTRSLQVPNWLPPQNPSTDVCYLIFNHNNASNSVKVSSHTENCPPKKRCYAVNNKDELCTRSDHILILEGVVCAQKSSQWYLSTSIIGRDNYFCSSGTNVLQFDYLENINSTLVYDEENLQRNVTPSAPRNDFLCDYGNSIPWSAVCDEKPDCHFGEDENEEQCLTKEKICKDDNNRCYCRADQFRCGNGQCVSKAYLCDGQRDCEDGSDEPEQCEKFSCAVYLNLTSPAKLCDFRQDCMDKSDEDRSRCPSDCDPVLSFNCSNSNKCVPLDFVCDGEQDCPDREDEANCFDFRSETTDSNIRNGTIWIQARGIWHELCARTEEYANLEEEKLCQQFGYSKLLKTRLISSSRPAETQFFSPIRLNNNKEIRLKNHRSKINNVNEECTTWNLLCE